MLPTQPCEVCGGHVVDLRRGRCFTCYQKWAESRPVGIGALCAVCSDRRRDNLRRIELLGAWVPLCGNCAGRIMRIEPLPRTLDGIRRSLERDRRRDDRRVGLPDGRERGGERRGLERRSVGHAIDGDLMLLDDALVVEFARPER